jgi:hypothetical protein
MTAVPPPPCATAEAATKSADIAAKIKRPKRIAGTSPILP